VPCLKYGSSLFLFRSLQENALCDDHLWAPSNASGDLCYVGETACTVSLLVWTRSSGTVDCFWRSSDTSVCCL